MKTYLALLGMLASAAVGCGNAPTDSEKTVVHDTASSLTVHRNAPLTKVEQRADPASVQQADPASVQQADLARVLQQADPASVQQVEPSAAQNAAPSAATYSETNLRPSSGSGK